MENVNSSENPKYFRVPVTSKLEKLYYPFLREGDLLEADEVKDLDEVKDGDLVAVRGSKEGFFLRFVFRLDEYYELTTLKCFDQPLLMHRDEFKPKFIVRRVSVPLERAFTILQEEKLLDNQNKGE